MGDKELEHYKKKLYWNSRTKTPFVYQNIQGVALKSKNRVLVHDFQNNEGNLEKFPISLLCFV